MSELSKHTRLFKNVKACKDLNWQEKAILSEIISYQLDEKPFKLKDITIAIELGMDKGTVSKFINRLYKKGLIDKTTVSYPSHEGGKPKRLRTVSVINIEQWTEKGKTAPSIKAIENNSSTVEPVANVPIIPKPISHPQEIKTKPTLEQMLKEAEAKEIQNSSDVLTLDIKKDITKNQYTLEHIVSEIQNGVKYKFIPVKVLHTDNSVTDDEAMQLPSMKIYALKSKLLAINSSLFN